MAEVLVGVVTFTVTLHELSKRQRERVADMLSGYAADVKKGVLIGAPVVPLYVEPEA